MLDYLGLKNHSQFTVFKRVHYETYIRKVIKFNIIQKITEEATKWVKTPGASDNLDSYLEKIKEIEREAQFIPDSYDSFKRKTYLDVDLNLYTQQHIKLGLAKKVKKTKSHNVCSDNYNDCVQYEQHKKQTAQGCCMCRCIARIHVLSHFGKSKTKKGRNKDVLDEQPKSDEQVYKKDIDDLIDYIMKPKEVKSK